MEKWRQWFDQIELPSLNYRSLMIIMALVAFALASCAPQRVSVEPTVTQTATLESQIVTAVPSATATLLNEPIIIPVYDATFEAEIDATRVARAQQAGTAIATQTVGVWEEVPDVCERGSVLIHAETIPTTENILFASGVVVEKTEMIDPDGKQRQVVELQTARHVVETLDGISKGTVEEGVFWVLYSDTMGTVYIGDPIYTRFLSDGDGPIDWMYALLISEPGLPVFPDDYQVLGIENVASAEQVVPGSTTYSTGHGLGYAKRQIIEGELWPDQELYYDIGGVRTLAYKSDILSTSYPNPWNTTVNGGFSGAGICAPLAGEGRNQSDYAIVGGFWGLPYWDPSIMYVALADDKTIKEINEASQEAWEQLETAGWTQVNP